MKPCESHHHSCDCREAKLRDVYANVKFASERGRVQAQKNNAMENALMILESMGYGQV